MAEIPYKHIDVTAYLANGGHLYEVVEVSSSLVSMLDCSTEQTRRESRAYISANFSLIREPTLDLEVAP